MYSIPGKQNKPTKQKDPTNTNNNNNKTPILLNLQTNKRNNNKDSNGQEKEKRASRRKWRGDRQREHIPKLWEKRHCTQHVWEAAHAQGKDTAKGKMLLRPSVGDVSRQVDRQLKRSQCLFSLLRLLWHRLLRYDFLFERLHLFVFSSSVPSV